MSRLKTMTEMIERLLVGAIRLVGETSIVFETSLISSRTRITATRGFRPSDACAMLLYREYACLLFVKVVKMQAAKLEALAETVEPEIAEML